ncbi:hypothetical protein [Shimazuella kribbensis]|uniref:hypothetical protein n=1 Tax=Shimazuella kribbensis TaxID=139808 RepID=UPI0004072A10|nr:hypothetical protein [Shimazuella kribbensis]
MTLPIQGSQITPPIPNNVQSECICVPKVYDFVVFTEDINATIPLPTIPPAGCPTTVTDITCSLTTEPFFPITCVTNGVCTILDRRPVNIDGINAALVKLRQDIPVDVTFTGTDVTGAPATCVISVLVPFIRQVVLCFPPEFTNDNVVCRIISGDCIITTPPPVGGILFPASVGLELFVCKEIQVVAAVKLEVLAKFCSPRNPIEIPVTSVCPTITFPEQCTFFPPASCQCQGILSDVTTTTAQSFRGIPNVSGTISANVQICSSCNPNDSSGTLSFRPDDPALEPLSVALTSCNPPFDCTDDRLFIRCEGIDLATGEQVLIQLALNQGTNQFGTIIISKFGNTIAFIDNVPVSPSGTLVVDKCRTF